MVHELIPKVKLIGADIVGGDEEEEIMRTAISSFDCLCHGPLLYDYFLLHTQAHTTVGRASASLAANYP
jgi:hypothetical protein